LSSKRYAKRRSPVVIRAEQLLKAGIKIAIGLKKSLIKMPNFARDPTDAANQACCVVA